jgi:hypothetical protein
MDDPLKTQLLSEDISTPSPPDNTDDDTPLLGLIITLLVVGILCGGGYLLYRNFNRTTNVPAALGVLTRTINQQNAPQ